jgi:hypothetical protein
VNTTGVKRKSKTLNKKINLPTVNVWRVKEPQASEYLDQEIIKFTNMKAKLNQRGRKLVVADGKFLNY